MNTQIPSLRQADSLLGEYIKYLQILQICVSYLHNTQNIQYGPNTLYKAKGKVSCKILVRNQAFRLFFLKGSHDLYIERIKVVDISLSRLPHDGFYSWLFLYSCMFQRSVCHVSCLDMNRNSLSYIRN